MLKKSGKVLLAYIIGIVVSMFLAVPLSPFFSNNLRLFSVITTVITLGLVYSEMWKLGKYDALRKEKPMPIDVYDAASWMAITALSEMSIARGGAVVDIPDFTNGKWSEELVQ